MMLGEGGILRGTARHSLWAAVQFLDDFTGRVMGPEALTIRYSEPLCRLVRKQDGWNLFLNVPGDVLTVTAEGQFYEEKTVEICRSDLVPLNPVVRVRMSPNRRYAVPAHATCLEGTALPGREIRLWCLNDPRPLRLQGDYSCDGPRQGRELRLFDPAGADPEGRSFALLRKDSREAELFHVSQSSEEDKEVCLLEKPLQASCKKAGAAVYPVYAARTDREGRFFLLLPGMAVRKLHCCVRVEESDGSWRETEAELESEVLTRLDLTALKG